MQTLPLPATPQIAQLPEVVKTSSKRPYYNGMLVRVLCAHSWHDRRSHNRVAAPVQAFAFEQVGELDKAESCGRVGTELHRADPWSHHAVAHTLYFQVCQDRGGVLRDGVGEGEARGGKSLVNAQATVRVCHVGAAGEASRRSDVDDWTR